MFFLKKALDLINTWMGGNEHIVAYPRLHGEVEKTSHRKAVTNYMSMDMVLLALQDKRHACPLIFLQWV